MTALFVTLYSYALAERLGELVLSRRNRRRMRELGFEQREGASSLGVMVALHVAWLLCTPLEAIFLPTFLPPGVPVVAAVVFSLTQLLRFWTLRTLGTHWNVSVMTAGKTSHGFVSDGPYRFIRHPNYLVVILEIATLPLVGSALYSCIVFSLLNALILISRIRVEERHLAEISGYAQAMSEKPRFIPLVFRRARPHAT